MAGHEWDWFQREELIGQISDIRVQNLQVERENVQKRTFTRWMNLHLEKCCPPLEVKDLFVDIQDGKILMALLEALTGHSLLHEYKSSSHRIFRLNNIAKSLKFLEDSNVKLVSIDAAEIADGNPSLVLGLIWNIILFLQIKELTGNLNRMASSSSLSSLPTGTETEGSQVGTPGTEKNLSTSFKDQRKAIKALLSWVQRRTRKYGVAVQDFGGSWRSGLAFLAVIKAIDSSLVDMKKALDRSPRENLEDAFTIAQHSLNIPRLLEPEDVMVNSPDEHSIMTYITQFLEHFPELDPDDFTDKNGDAPVEMTYVHYKDGPREEASQLITLPKNEDNDITMELQTRPLTPPETHVYTQVNVAGDLKLNSEDQLSHPHWLSSGTPQGSAGFTSNRFPHDLETSSSNPPNVSVSAPSNGVNDHINGGGLVDTKVDGLEGHVEPFLLPNGQGALHHNRSDEHPLNIYLNRDKDPDSKYALSNIYSKSCDSSSSFSSISDKEPNDLSSQSEGYQASDDSLKQSPVSDDSGLVTPHEEGDEDFKYVLHLPKDSLEGDSIKQLTVFQAYKGSTEEKPISTSRRDSSGDTLAEVTDGRSSAKVSVIPHDLFYYPHYSVPIADVLQAFADSQPDGIQRSDTESEASSEAHTDGTFSGDEEWETTKMENVTTDDNVEHVEYMKIGSTAPSLGSINGSVSQPAHDRQSNSFIVQPDHYEHSQVTSQPQNPDLNDNIRSRKGMDKRNSESAAHAVQVAEDRETKLRAGVEAGGTEPRLASNENVRHAHSRKEPELHKLLNCDELQESTENNSHQTSRVSNLKDTMRSFFLNDPRSMYHIGLLLWFICYCALILPELDMDNVAFFVDNN
ncbi:calmin [Gastrophryne carolinensis]